MNAPKNYAIAGVRTSGCDVCGKQFLFTRTADNWDEAVEVGWYGDHTGWYCPEHASQKLAGDLYDAYFGRRVDQVDT